MAVGAQIGSVLKQLNNGRIEVITVLFNSGTTAVFTSKFSRFVPIGAVGLAGTGGVLSLPTALTPVGTPTVTSDGGYVNPQAGSGTQLVVTAASSNSDTVAITLLEI